MENYLVDLIFGLFHHLLVFLLVSNLDNDLPKLPKNQQSLSMRKAFSKHILYFSWYSSVIEKFLHEPH
jgi:hypothetical protein